MLERFSTPSSFIKSLFAYHTGLMVLCATAYAQSGMTKAEHPRERISINKNWKFYKYTDPAKADTLIYDVRPNVNDNSDNRPADAKPTEAVTISRLRPVLRSYIMPSGNDFIKDPNHRYLMPKGNPGADFPFVKTDFNDNDWTSVDLPHDWAIKGPFYTGQDAIIGGGMGRLPVQGVAWYRKKIAIKTSDAGKSVYLDVDGAMSYAMVWFNGHLVGGWPYGYSSWRVDLSPYIIPGKINQLAIRLDNPVNSSRWYPGGGIYRNVWLTKVNKVHVGQWGVFCRTGKVSDRSAQLNLTTYIENTSQTKSNIKMATAIYRLNSQGQKIGKPVAKTISTNIWIAAHSHDTVSGALNISNPQLWQPLPGKYHPLYTAVTTIFSKNIPIDTYETHFGIRNIRFDPKNGLIVNGKKTFIRGVNQHADLGALGMAFNERAAARQLEILRAIGCNAIRLAHNPPAPELLDLADQMGFMIVDEIFDDWELKKTPLDFHLIFPDWSEQDLRAMIRRDRNHPCVMLWSFGNEVGEQYTGEAGAAVAKRLYSILKEEDTTRKATLAMNYAKPDMPLPAVVDVVGLNYQGEGIRNAPAYAGLKGISTPPSFPAFHAKFPDKVIISSENAAAVSSRGEYQFPVFEGNSAPVKDGRGGNPKTLQVSAYELYSVDFGSSADKVFATMAGHPYVAGGFVWSGWDYLGEPTPYYSARSSYFGIIDLAGFPKDRYYLYQAQWRPELPLVHILPHWTWPERTGQITPVHVFTSGDEAELFLNGRSLGRKKAGKDEFRIRWDDVRYEAGELKVTAYKNGKKWAEEKIETTGEAAQINITADRPSILADGKDLSFLTVRITDKQGRTIPRAKNLLRFSVEGAGEIVATDNGDASSMVAFPSHEREAFNGLCLVIVSAGYGLPGNIKVTAKAQGLKDGVIWLKSTTSQQ
jgi:beta-galactosidase